MGSWEYIQIQYGGGTLNCRDQPIPSHGYNRIGQGLGSFGVYIHFNPQAVCSYEWTRVAGLSY